MPYIKITDPGIIDISAWHQVINVVNQHSDSITAITNNFGAQGSGVVDWNATDYAHEFNSGNQKIIYGRASSAAGTYDSATAILYGTVNLIDTISGTTAFSQTPIVTATAYSGNTSGSVSPANDDVIVSVYNITTSSFKYRLFRAKSNTSTAPISGTVFINWMALGPK
jgi:hypothetical protein